ncbi:MAG TPA: hypothetical protein QGH28_02160 [Chloroflexota bacterium]|nr:hypothetical protein [Chloroflexota bacterium]
MAERVWSEERGVFRYNVVARVNHPMSVHAFHSRGGVGERSAPMVGIHEYGEGKVGSGKHWERYAREVQHTQPHLNCFGFRFETDEGVIAFSGDTAPVDSVVELARDADLLVQNVMELGSVIRTIPEGETMTGTTDANHVGRCAAGYGGGHLGGQFVVRNQDRFQPEQILLAVVVTDNLLFEVRHLSGLVEPSVHRGCHYFSRDFDDLLNNGGLTGDLDLRHDPDAPIGLTSGIHRPTTPGSRRPT